MTDLLQVPRPLGGFKKILADPPWAFETYTGGTGTPHRSAVDHYDTVAGDALAAIPVGMLAARDCALFMWVVDSHVPDAIALAKVWGFTFKTVAFIWDKGEKIGMGYWTRKQGELCFLFTRGTPKVRDHGVRQIIRAPRREHSRKPDEQYARIGRLVHGPGLELFARQAWPGWSAWGNQTDLFPAAQHGAQGDGVTATDAGQAQVA